MAPWPAGTGREIHAELDSTNAEGLRRAAAGERGPLWILALRQTMGRGRRGRGWASGEGNLAASLVMVASGGLQAAALRSFTASLGLFDALVLATGRPELFTLKWPNDVLLNGAKLAGILLETAGPQGRGLVIGVGVNLARAPEAAQLEPGAVPPASLAEGSGITMAPEAFLDLLAPAVEHWEDRLLDEGFAPVRAAWLARAGRIGEELTARLPGRAITGVFETIDETGAIVLAAPGGRVALPAAEIFFGNGAGNTGTGDAAGH
jgi:BirA family transcriptional regulator, biotin operon repressor / biotin---[acetyl-CoA-carboxylase] ligase